MTNLDGESYLSGTFGILGVEISKRDSVRRLAERAFCAASAKRGDKSDEKSVSGGRDLGRKYLVYAQQRSGSPLGVLVRKGLSREPGSRKTHNPGVQFRKKWSSRESW